MINIGQHNTLRVDRILDQGAYLEDQEGNSVLLPKRYVSSNLKIDDELTVFIYNDSEDRPVATTEEPLVALNDFAMLKAVGNTKYGTFMDWGLAKDLLVPFREQNKEMREGYYYLIYLYLDEETNRLVGSNKITKYLKSIKPDLKYGEEVDLIVWNKTDLGVKVIVNGAHQGLLYNNEIFNEIKMGDRIKGFVKLIREDNKLDISLQKQGYSNIEPNAKKILEKLESNRGFVALNDKSAPELIVAALGMSKSTFKKSIGALYKLRKISIDKDGIRLLK
ncbi:S1-like domain-containing RNA-binding protein [Flavobacteriales bacterium]|nr:S1-like domain-containing RNA-binding protein [Flavobacteriales bacterium]MDC3337139.1 S1-like domain-containing RNA-binding protein [Flavobacteriales bacterium]